MGARGHLGLDLAGLLPAIAAGLLGHLVALLGAEPGQLGLAEVVEGGGVLVHRVGRGDPGVEPGPLLDPLLDLRLRLVGEPPLAVVRRHPGGLLPLDPQDQVARVGVGGDDVLAALAAGHQRLERRHVELAVPEPRAVAGVAPPAVGDQDRRDVALEREGALGGGRRAPGAALALASSVASSPLAVPFLAGAAFFLADFCATRITRAGPPSAQTISEPTTRAAATPRTTPRRPRPPILTDIGPSRSRCHSTAG